MTGKDKRVARAVSPGPRVMSWAGRSWRSLRQPAYADCVKLLIWIVSTMAGLAVAAWLFDGISVTGADWSEKAAPLLGAALILGLVTALVEPVVKFFSFPLIILTIGLFALVVNALMLHLTSWLAEQVDVGFRVDGFWTALFGSIVITLVASLTRAFFPEEDRS